MNPTFILWLGIGTGFVLGLLLAWIRAARQRAEAALRLNGDLERLTRAETLVEELRRRLDEEQRAADCLRDALRRAQQASAVAETKSHETTKYMEEQKRLLLEARQELQTSFQALSAAALRQNSEAFLQLAQTSFTRQQVEATGELGKREQAIHDLVKPLQEQLSRYEEQIRHLEHNRIREQGGLEQHLKVMAESQQRLQQETGNLVKALRAPAIRGRWGEMTLRRVAELAGMVAHCDFKEQAVIPHEDGSLRPDMVVRLPAGRQVVVDAKTVLSAYLDAHESQDEATRLTHLTRHAAQVRSRMEELSLKAYWNQFQTTPEFVVLFLPGEQFLGAALEQDPSLIEDGFARGVVIATPTTLMALLRAVAYGWRQEQLTEHAATAARLGKDLYERMAVLTDHFGEIGQSLGRSVQAYNKAVASLESRVLPAARRFKELGVSSDRDLESLEGIDVVPKERPSLVARNMGSVE